MTGTPVNDYEADPEWRAAYNWWTSGAGINATGRRHVRQDAIYAMYLAERASEVDPGWAPRPQLVLTEVHNVARCKARRLAAAIARTEGMIAVLEGLLSDVSELADRGSSLDPQLAAAYTSAHAQLADRLTAYRAAAA